YFVDLGRCHAVSHSTKEPSYGGRAQHETEMTASPSIINHDRPDLDRTCLGAGNPRGNGDGGVEILGLDQIIAAELFARLRDPTIRCQGLAVADPHGGCRR